MMKRLISFAAFVFLLVFPYIFLPANVDKSRPFLKGRDKTADFRKSFSGLSLFLDLSSPSEINFQLDWEDKIKLSGNYVLAHKDLKVAAFFKDIDLTNFSAFIKNFDLKKGYIKKGDLNLEGREAYLLSGDLEIRDIFLIKETVELRGHLDLSPQVTFSKEKMLDYYLSYQIKDARFLNCENIQAKGFFRKDELILEAGCLNYKGIPWEVKGDVRDFSHPKIKLNAANSLLSLEAKAEYNKEEWVVEELILQGKDTKIFAKGSIALKEKPQIKIEGAGYIEFNDILEVIKAFNLNYTQLTKLNPHGKLNAKFIVSGGTDAQNLEIKLAGKSEKLSIYDLWLSKVNIELYKDKNTLTISPFLANLGEGKIEFRGKFDFLTNNATVNLIANRVELKNLMEQLNLKNKKLAGKLSFEAYLENDKFPKWDRFNGQGSIQIEEGNIWEINFLRGLGEFLFIPDFEEIKFSQGYSDIFFKEGSIILENLELTSSQMSLTGGGKIIVKPPYHPPIKGDVDFLLFPEFNSGLISASVGLKKTITDFLGKSGLAIEIKGTFNKPKYKIKSLLFSPLKRITDFFEGLLDNR
ncbi:MAG: hypothetical protein KJ711_05395 [Candidatus Omnitrophica bacterium]|nr:hypothetical protein [Candidatus Omnitrophota bacterium]MBU1524544.1 hypothetical protein [Candidatus Omnitrophota bacterium]